MAYGNLLADVVQSSTTGTPPQFNDGSGTQTGTLCRAWVNFNGASGTINGSFNVSSVTYNSAGRYTVNLTNALVDANGSAVIGGTNNTLAVPQNRYLGISVATSSTIKVAADSSAGSASDLAYCYVAVYR